MPRLLQNASHIVLSNNVLHSPLRGSCWVQAGSMELVCWMAEIAGGELQELPA